MSDELNNRQKLVRDFLLVMVNNIGDKQEKLNVARFYADEVLADRPTLGSDRLVEHSASSSHKPQRYRVTGGEGGKFREPRAIIRQSHENIGRNQF